MNEDAHISIVGLPASGKTTYLAALWHMVREPGANTNLHFTSLKTSNYEHLNTLAKLWRSGKIQQRTQTSGLRTVIMTLGNAEGREVEISFPDIPGEDFSDMWEKREVDESVRKTLSARDIVLIVNGDTIKLPAWVAERNKMTQDAGLPIIDNEPVDWSPNFSPTQVKLVALLQFLMSETLNVGPRRVAILISAWDKVEGEQLSPTEIMSTKLPLLFQYLQSGRDPWDWEVWGVSAQGGDYEDPEKDQHFAVTDALRDLDRPSDRIKIVRDAAVTSDITLPLAWLMK
ncbi:TRAFAC clade GTPase domain-containing protein [Sphingomonas sp. Mn802worker]|uniref:TRAFAC clade GTPase domain-containing protein n=1 Tax=Sphingomonas sp. Mn802worker TaxID=629773 RepID=UPI0012EA60E6|nr:hypothetical protein [Sphingomonas sp. Mn802worker]